MNIPPSSTSREILSKSWDPQSSIQSAMHAMEVSSGPVIKLDNDASFVFISKRSTLDPFSNPLSLYPDKGAKSIVNFRNGVRRSMSLVDALGPNFGKVKDEAESDNYSSSQISRTVKKRGSSCANCGATNTPSWRRSQDDNRLLLCNACGLRDRASKKKPKLGRKLEPPHSPISPQSQSHGFIDCNIGFPRNTDHTSSSLLWDPFSFFQNIG